MSANAGQRASDLAARQVEQIVAAAQAAAEELRREALLEGREIRAAAEREAKEAVERARRGAEQELRDAQRRAITLGEDARQNAETVLREAQVEAAQVRERTVRAMDGRVAAAERAASEVLEEARTLSGGLRQLGKALEDHAERILREVTVAHKRMQADLRVEVADVDGRPSAAIASDGDGYAPADSRRRLPATRPDDPPRRPNPFEEIDVPSWVGRER